jgi:hypothetical protein
VAEEDAGGFSAIPNDFRGALNDKGALFAAYVACRHIGLRDLFSGSKILLQANVDRHHLLPRAQRATQECGTYQIHFCAICEQQ